MNLNEYITGTYGTIYYVTDMKKASQYYKEVLNLSAEEESPEWTTFSIGGTHRVCLHLTSDSAKVNGQGILVMNVRNLEAVCEEVKKRGAELVNGIHEVCPNGFSFDVRDPNGVALSFFEYKG